MTAKTLKAELYKELEKNHLELVIAKLKTFYDKSSECYRELFSIAFQLNALESTGRKGIFVKGVKDSEFDSIRNELYQLISELTEEDIFAHKFEHNYAIGNKANIGISDKSESSSWGREVFNFIKYTISLLLIMVLFVVDGMDVVESNMAVLERNDKIESLKKEVRELVVKSKLEKALTKLSDNISENSKFYNEVSLMKSRFVDNEGDKRQETVKREDYTQEKNRIKSATLQILDKIEPKDLAFVQARSFTL